MTANVEPQENGKVLMVHLEGTLRAEDYKTFVPAVEKEIGRHGKIRMIVEMTHFHGWDAGAAWEDLKFDVKHFRDIERLAFVGERKWEEWMARFCKPFTTAQVRYFPAENESEARAWIVSN